MRRATASPIRATVEPTIASSTQWFPVAIVAQAMATGMATAASDQLCGFVPDRPTCHHAMPASRFQPTCKLGIAAYLLTRPGGCSTRYELECRVTVSTNSGENSLGGAIGSVA
jgi:hypothetical protein